MGQEPDRVGFRRLLINSGVLALGVFLLAFGEWSARFTSATVAAISALARLSGGEAVMTQGKLHWRELDLTWTEDCSGVQSLFILFGITAWVAFRDPFGKLIWKLLLTVPMAILANLLRVLLIGMFRFCLHPLWEGETLHFAFGFISIAPFIVLIARTQLREARIGVAWLVYLTSILAVCSLRIDSPGGLCVLGSTVAYLVSLHHGKSFSQPTSIVTLLAWLCAAIAIVVLRAESLWLVWLLVCPLVIDRKTFLRPLNWVLLIGTVPMFAVSPVVQALVVVACGWLLFNGRVGLASMPQQADLADVQPTGHARLITFVTMTAVFALPTFGEHVAATQHARIDPPASVMSAPVDRESFRVRTIGQSNEIAVFWHGGNQLGRHHSIKTCLRFRGVETHTIPDAPGTMQSESMWIREFFILDGHLYPSYLHYITRCFPPFTSHGIHLVFQASKTAVDVEHFQRETEQIAEELYQDHLGTVTTTSRPDEG